MQNYLAIVRTTTGRITRATISESKAQEIKSSILALFVDTTENRKLFNNLAI